MTDLLKFYILNIQPSQISSKMEDTRRATSLIPRSNSMHVMILCRMNLTII